MDQQVPLQPEPHASVTSTTSSMAITSLVLGISSFFCWIFTALPAVILGIVALRKIKRSNGQLKGDGLAIAGIITGALSSAIILPMMIALLLPAVSSAPEAARRSMSINNMKQIGLALQIYHDTKHSLPAAGGGAAQESQLSWRVHLLPYLEEQALYEQFHLDEPWDSEHNRALISKMPAVFKDPNERLAPGETSYLAVTGPGTAFGEGDSDLKFQDFTDGPSKTIMVVEANPDQSVVWTKPDDWQYLPIAPTRGLGLSRLYGFLALFGDAHVEFIRNDSAHEAVKAMMTRDGREMLQ